MPVVRFPRGQVVAAPGPLSVLNRNQAQPLTFLARHQAGEWGDPDSADLAENEHSLDGEFRLLSAYTLSGGTRIWIMDHTQWACYSE